MAKMKQLLESIQRDNQRPYAINKSYYTKEEHRYHFYETEKMIERMTPEDFAVTYGKDTGAHEIPLVFVMLQSKAIHLAELIIKKNPVFAAKIDGVLWHACHHLKQDDTFKIANLLIPYMSQEALLAGLEHSGTFLHTAAQERSITKPGCYLSTEKNYKVAGAVPPEIISIILRETVKTSQTSEENSCYRNSPIQLTQFLHEAIHVYDMEIAQHPQEADNYFRKGVILQGMGKNEKAIKCYKKAIELDHTYADKIEGIELSTLPAPTVVVTDTSVQDDRELMKAKISELTQELSKLMQKTTALTEEVTFLRGSLKVVEEHKGQAPAEPPSYEEEVHVEAPALPASLPPDIALMGSVGTCDVTLHYDS